MKKKLSIIACIIVILLGLLLCLATLAGLIFVIGGILLLIYVIKAPDKSQQRKQSEPVKIDSAKIAAPAIEPPPGKPRKQVTCKIAGVTHKCQNDEDTKRADILANMTEGDPVDIEPYTYRGEQAYLIVDQATHLDIGNVPSDMAAALSEFPDPQFFAYLTTVDSFINDDGDEIYYGRVRIQLY